MKTLIKVKPFFIDERGSMTHLLPKNTEITGALLITCKKGSVRANHYHKKDQHFAYMLKGSMKYTYRPLKGKRKQSVIARQGDVVYTPPNVLHRMEFLTDAVFLALTTEKRDRKAYEADTVRIDSL